MNVIHNHFVYFYGNSVRQMYVKPPFRKLVEVWRALSCDHPLCDIIPKCLSHAPGFSFGRNDGFKLPCLYPSNLYGSLMPANNFFLSQRGIETSIV